MKMMVSKLSKKVEESLRLKKMVKHGRKMLNRVLITKSRLKLEI
jgi:hypothetical protein